MLAHRSGQLVFPIDSIATIHEYGKAAECQNSGAQQNHWRSASEQGHYSSAVDGTDENVVPSQMKCKIRRGRQQCVGRSSD